MIRSGEGGCRRVGGWRSGMAGGGRGGLEVGVEGGQRRGQWERGVTVAGEGTREGGPRAGWQFTSAGWPYPVTTVYLWRPAPGRRRCSVPRLQQTATTMIHETHTAAKACGRLIQPTPDVSRSPTSQLPSWRATESGDLPIYWKHNREIFSRKFLYVEKQSATAATMRLYTKTLQCKPRLYTSLIQYTTQVLT